MRIAYISYGRDMYIIFRITLNFTTRHRRARTGVGYIYLNAHAAINLIIYLRVMYVRALVINCHNLYARNFYFTLCNFAS